MKKYNIGFIGYGNMAKAITDKLLSEDGQAMLADSEYALTVIAYDTDDGKFTDAQPELIRASNNAELVEKSDIVFIAVKPQNAQAALCGLDFSGKIAVSIMASVKLKTLNEYLGGKTDKLVRVMPNLNARIGAACTAFCCEGLSEEEKQVIATILYSFGDVAELKEEQMNAATGLCGSGPAFVFMFIDALRESGVQNGLNESVALKMAISTVMGSAMLIDSYGDSVDIAALVRSVCSKGGTTIEGVNRLNESDFGKIAADAVTKAVKRAEEMSAENEKR